MNTISQPQPRRIEPQPAHAPTAPVTPATPRNDPDTSGPPPTDRATRRFKGYVIALIATAGLLSIRLALDTFLQASSPFLFFAPAVMISAWYGGRGPGLLATVAGAMAANYFLLGDANSFARTPDDLTKTAVFLIVGAQISWLSGALHAAKGRAELDARAARRGEELYRKLATELTAARTALQAAHDELEVRVRERTAELEFRRTLLEAQSDASLDGILVADDAGQIIFRNRRLADLWALPHAAFATTRDAAVAAMRAALAQPQDPLGGGADLDAPRAPELPANLVLRDGRTLECYGAPVESAAGHSYGRAWYFRDVTERRRTSRQILEAGERERHRIGQDLHDDLCQHLTGIACLGRVLHQRLQPRLPAEAPAAAQVVDLVEQAVRRARDIARGLQPLQLATAGLPAALHELATTVERMFQVRCHFTGDPSVALEDPASPIQLYRITQEAITNAVRHGRARNVYIDLVEVEGRVILTVEDDGQGIHHAAPPAAAPGLGVRTMRHRARMIGATLAIEPADAGGTIVTCKLPARPVTPPLDPAGVPDAE
jgi:signal transduction histidine kinase